MMPIPGGNISTEKKWRDYNRNETIKKKKKKLGNFKATLIQMQGEDSF